jgi:hypothetical protein
MADFTPPAKALPRSPGHHKEFMDACLGGAKAGSDFVNKACGLTEMVLIGHLAAHVGPGKKIEWDAANAKVKNIPEANAYVNKVYRKGWVD